MRPTRIRPSRTPIVAGTAPAERTAASLASPTATPSGAGKPVRDERRLERDDRCARVDRLSHLLRDHDEVAHAGRSISMKGCMPPFVSWTNARVRTNPGPLVHLDGTLVELRDGEPEAGRRVPGARELRDPSSTNAWPRPRPVLSGRSPRPSRDVLPSGPYVKNPTSSPRLVARGERSGRRDAPDRAATRGRRDPRARRRSRTEARSASPRSPRASSWVIGCEADSRRAALTAPTLVARRSGPPPRARGRGRRR